MDDRQNAMSSVFYCCFLDVSSAYKNRFPLFHLSDINITDVRDRTLSKSDEKGTTPLDLQCVRMLAEEKLRQYDTPPQSQSYFAM